MYSLKVVAQEQERMERSLKIKLLRYEPGYCADIQEHLERRFDEFEAASPNLTLDLAFKQLTVEEKAFVRNERLLGSLDFDYWSRRYGWLLPDASVSAGDLVRFEPWDSQRIVLDEMARLEESSYAAMLRKEPQDGVLVAVPKARQEGISLLAAMVKMHRVTTSPYTLAVTASENETKRLSLYVRDERIYAKLPWYMRPARTPPDIQGERLTFGAMESSITYQDYAQKGSLAAGEQYLVGHLSELAQGDDSYVRKLMTLDYFPAIPQSWRACHLLESTPAGMGGFWHEFILDSISGAGRWKVKFIPWYTLPFKYTRTPPATWQPSQKALEHAVKVEETSMAYVGKKVALSATQLYWWESTREAHRKSDKLPMFLTNYPATLEESFQTYAISIFGYDTIDHYRTMAKEPGGCYEVVER